MDWLTTFHYQLTNRKGNSIFDILLFAAGILFLIERLKLHESQLWNVLVWTMVILSSVITILNYVQLLMETWSTIRNNIIIWLSCIICFGGFMSSLTLLYTIGQAIHVATTQFELYSTIMLFLAASARITHCYLGVLFFSLVGPISKQWVHAHASSTRINLSSMIYFKFFLYVHWGFSIFTFKSVLEQGLVPGTLHVFSFLYRTCGLVWIWWLLRECSTKKIIQVPIQETERSNQRAAIVTGMLPNHPYICETIVFCTIVTFSYLASPELVGSELVFPHVGYLL